MRLCPHLTFTGRCEEAFRFYANLFGGTLDVTRYGDTPMAAAVPSAFQAKAVHATLKLPGGPELLGADVLPGQNEGPLNTNWFVFVAVRDQTKADRIFRALSEAGSVRMPLQKTFWSPAFGVVVDRFGTPWEITCE